MSQFLIHILHFVLFLSLCVFVSFLMIQVKFDTVPPLSMTGNLDSIACGVGGSAMLCTSQNSFSKRISNRFTHVHLR